MADWPDIPGITAAAGRARLPRRPEVVVVALAAAARLANTGAREVEVRDAMRAATRDDEDRLAGLSGWLPLSRVLAWDADGALRGAAGTDLVDLAHRFAAWVGAQPVGPDVADRRDALAHAVVDRAVAHPPIVVAAGGLPEVSAAPTAAAADTALVEPALGARVARLLGALDAAFLERGSHVRAALLALLAEQHVLLLGPPGTAKSMLARALCRCFEGAAYFEYLLSRFTHPDELFGPVSIPGLKEEDYRRLTEGYLPRAGVAFLDEVFKANSAILNSLLTLVNERVFHHGRHRDAVPLIGLVGASNELPAEEGLAALFDRFLVRLSVPPLGETASFLAVATGTVPEPEIPAGEALTAADRAAIRDAARRVRVPDAVADALVALWQEGSRREWGVSDRRWRQAVHLLKVAAATAGRDAVEPLDLLLLEPILAPTPERAGEVRDLLVAGLGARSVPEHDLRAQWLLLGRGDRVAPAAGEPEAPPAGPHWSARLARRRAAVARFLAHHREAVARLAADRRALERRAEAHPWIAALPSRVLAAHVQAARDLVGILEVAEAYAADLDGPAAVARALLHRLPERPRRYYGTDVACVLSIPDAGARCGLTLAGERLALEGADPDAIEIAVPAERFLAWVDGEAEADLLRGAAPGQRAAATALDSARRLLGRQVIPRPPELPPYSGLSA